MTPDEHPTLEEWIAVTQACCGVDHPDDVDTVEVPKTDEDGIKNDPGSDVGQPQIADR